MKEDIKTALTIAGSDPTGGAGLQADLRTFSSMGVFGLSVASVLTVQNTIGVDDIFELPPDLFTAQLDCLLKDIRPDALKTGMIYSAEVVEIAAQMINDHSLKNLVVDPVIKSSTGVPLITKDAVERIKQSLFPLAKAITPNIGEAEMLTGMEIKSQDDIKKAALKLKEYGPEAVIITGLNLQGQMLDMLFDGKDFLSLENKALDGEYHGTGCVFSSVITAGLALGYDLNEAFVKAKEFVWKAMKEGVSVGQGLKVLGF